MFRNEYNAMRKVFVIAQSDVESYSIFAICLSEETAKKKYYELKQNLLEKFNHMIMFVKQDGRNPDIYESCYDYVSKCEFPNIHPDHSYCLERPIVEEYELLE